MTVVSKAIESTPAVNGKFIPSPNPHPPLLPHSSRPDDVPSIPQSAKGTLSHRKARPGASTRAAICREPYPALSPMGMGGVASAGERSASAFAPARARREGRWCRWVRRGRGAERVDGVSRRVKVARMSWVWSFFLAVVGQTL